MRYVVALILAALTVSPAAAQQQSISEYTLGITQAVTQLGQAAENLQKQKAALEAQLKTMQQRLDDLTKVKTAAPVAKPLPPPVAPPTPPAAAPPAPSAPPSPAPSVASPPGAPSLPPPSRGFPRTKKH